MTDLLLSTLFGCTVVGRSCLAARQVH